MTLDPSKFERWNAEIEARIRGEFVPSTEWQDVPDGTVLPPGGEYRIDFATGKNQARWDNPPAPATVMAKHPKTPASEPTVIFSKGQQPPARKGKKNAIQLILPSGHVQFSETAQAMFTVLGKRYRYFVRGRAIVELAYQKILADKQPHTGCELLHPDALRSRLEHDFVCRSWHEDHGKYVLKAARCSRDLAQVLLRTDEAFELLPPLNTLSAVPVLSGEQGNLQVLAKGYHGVHGGIYVGSDARIVLPTLQTAKELLLDALTDFDFVSPSDKSRAVASLLNPAMRAGHLLGPVDFPIDVGEANDSQSGKTFRYKMVFAIYGEIPYVVSSRQGGVGSLDESISSALIAGIPFIFFDNFRGLMESQLVETCLRGTGMAPARAPHRGEIQVPTTHINWQLSSNGLEATRDFVNRAFIVRILKRGLGYEFKNYPEGNILAHIKANSAHYLAAVFRILYEWDRRGRPRTNEARHDFVEWAQVLDWIVQNIFDLGPLLDGHTEEVLRVSNPTMSWLRHVAIAVEKENRTGEALSASEIVDVCQARGVEIPTSVESTDPDQLPMYYGRLLGRLFGQDEELTIDRFRIRREDRIQIRAGIVGGNYLKHYYLFKNRTEVRT